MQISRWNYQILLLTCLLLLSCGQSKVDKTGDIPVIDIIGSLGEYEAIPVSQYITELEYIPLETRDDCLIGGWIGSIVTSTHIFVLNNKFCYAFGRDGRFLGQIGSAGQGPGEYSSLNDFTVDEKKRSLYLETSRTLLEYSWDNTFRQSINLPQNKYETPLNNIIFVRDNLFLGHSRNYKGDLNHNFILFDESSEIVKSFDNYMQFNRARLVGGQDDGSMKPYRKGEYVHVKEISNDTLFLLNEQNELIPQYIFNLGEYTVTKEIRENLAPGGADNTKKIILPLRSFLPMIETPNHIFFSLMAANLSGKYTFPKKKELQRDAIPPGITPIETDDRALVGIYDAASQTTRLLDTDPVTRMSGLINDLDGGLSFWPRYYTSDNELVDMWRVEDMKELLTEEYFAAHEIKDPIAHQKLKTMLQKLDEDDNPVVVIAKLKIGVNRGE